MTQRVLDRTALSPRTLRKRERDIDDVYALVLHQTGFSRGNDPSKYDKVKAHFVILPDGSISQNHPLTSRLDASNGLNAGSVAAEFVGNLPSTRGQFYKPEKFGRDELTQAQVDAGLYLVGHLMVEMGLTHVLAHRQASGQKGNCPGPDVWYQVGQRTIELFGLADGGPDFSVGSGKPIPEQWRTWGR